MLSAEEQERLIREQHETYTWLNTASINVAKQGKPELLDQGIINHPEYFEKLKLAIDVCQKIIYLYFYILSKYMSHYYSTYYI